MTMLYIPKPVAQSNSLAKLNQFQNYSVFCAFCIYRSGSKYSNTAFMLLEQNYLCILHIPTWNRKHNRKLLSRNVIIWPLDTKMSVGLDNHFMCRNLLTERLLTNWGRVTYICISKLTILDSDNVLSPARPQAIIWNNARILLIKPLGKNFSEILIELYTFSFNKLHLNMAQYTEAQNTEASAILSRPQCVKDNYDQREKCFNV